MELVFATHNENKLQEVQALLPKKIKLLSLTDIGCVEPIPEYGKTLEENAWIKANFVKDHYEMDCFADDTGLEVDALQGAPGVFSARYAGEEKDAEQNMSKLLNALGTSNNRQAQFRTLIALHFKGATKTFEGIAKGTILHKRRGKQGFGYDSIFQGEGMEQSFAELSLEEKNAVSHRKRAFRQLLFFVKTVS